MLQINTAKAIKWRAVFAESAFIGASILLAFALQDWDEERDIEERTHIAMCNVKSELAFNRVLIKRGYVPKQQGLLATIRAAISMGRQGDQARSIDMNLESMLIQESLRYSAWSLAGESGYMLHANYELATEIGAVIDFQKDSYQPVINRLNAAIFNHGEALQENKRESHVRLISLTNEWVAQTRYLESKYEMLFARDDFTNMECAQ
ncbi:hypothetical protein [Planctobacterium marinum]|uniref:Uncharacterized protein n=1 Tax=Planctobacterium marinum TaxID=1631968 RepID=A0AA48HKA3_9ALTE|nr:hypothetical protein MACH26_06430 [Planctobacterium marinum]